MKTVEIQLLQAQAVLSLVESELLVVVELVAVGTSWDDFQRLYKDYKNGDELSVWEERANECYERGRQEGFKQGEIAHMNRDSKRYCTTCGGSK